MWSKVHPNAKTSLLWLITLCNNIKACPLFGQDIRCFSLIFVVLFIGGEIVYQNNFPNYESLLKGLVVSVQFFFLKRDQLAALSRQSIISEAGKTYIVISTSPWPPSCDSSIVWIKLRIRCVKYMLTFVLNH